MLTALAGRGQLSALAARRRMAGGGESEYDPDAQNYIDAVEATDAGAISESFRAAINTFVLAIKAHSIWDKCNAIYPFVGGTAASHSVNLIDPAGPTITWAVGVTHSASGVDGDGSQGNSATGYTVGDLVAAEDAHAICRGNSRAINNRAFIVDTQQNRIYCGVRFSGQVRGRIQSNTLSDGSAPSPMFFAVNRSGTSFRMFADGTLDYAGTDTPLEFHGTNAVNLIPSHDCNISFVSLGLSLTDTQHSQLWAAVQSLETVLRA